MLGSSATGADMEREGEENWKWAEQLPLTVRAMAKSIRSKIKRKWRAEKRKQIGRPVEDKRLNDALSRLQGKLVKGVRTVPSRIAAPPAHTAPATLPGSRLELAKQALAGKGEAVEVVNEDVNADKRFSFADRSWKEPTPAFNKSLHAMIQEEISAGAAAKKEKEEAEKQGVDEEDEDGVARGGEDDAEGDERLTQRDKESIATAAAAAGEFSSSLAYLGRDELKSSTDHSSRALSRLRRRKKPRHEVFF